MENNTTFSKGTYKSKICVAHTRTIVGVGPGEWWWRKMMCIQMEKWTREASYKNQGEKRDLCISVLPRYCYVTLDKSFHALILVFHIGKIGRYEPSHHMSWRMSTEEVSAAEWKVHGLWTWPSWWLSGFGEALTLSDSILNELINTGFPKKGTFEQSLAGGNGVSYTEIWVKVIQAEERVNSINR